MITDWQLIPGMPTPTRRPTRLHLTVIRLRPGHWWAEITDASGLLTCGGMSTHAAALALGLRVMADLASEVTA